MGQALVNLTLIFKRGDAGAVVEARRYGDSLMVELMGLSTVLLGTSNFQNISLFTRSHGFGAVSQFQPLPMEALDYLMMIQPQDAGSMQSKMNFLMNDSRGRPYWTRNGTWYNRFPNTTLSFGTIVFGGQPCLVETVRGVKKEYRIWGKYQAKLHEQEIVFYKLMGMPWAERARYSPGTHPWFIQRGTWATWETSPPDQYRDTWYSGVVYHPVWRPEDFPVNYGDTELFLARDFVL